MQFGLVRDFMDVQSVNEKPLQVNDIIERQSRQEEMMDIPAEQQMDCLMPEFGRILPSQVSEQTFGNIASSTAAKPSISE